MRNDLDAPTIQSVITQTVASKNNITVTTNDASGTYRLLITWTDGETVWRSTDLQQTADETWHGTIETNRPFTFLVQAVDKAGNVGVATNHGSYYTYQTYHVQEAFKLYIPLLSW